LFGFPYFFIWISGIRKKKLKKKEEKESFRFENYFIRDFSTVEAAIIKQNNLKQKISTVSPRLLNPGLNPSSAVCISAA
jgi:hypothetical protein